MALKFLATTATAEVRAAQQHYYGRSQPIPEQAESDPMGVEAAEFIARRDSFYIATGTSDGWPCLQHRGGPTGFLKVIDAHTLGFADF